METCTRTVHHADALVWLERAGRLHGASAITSLPDISELPGLGFAGWRRWFEDAAVAVMNAVPDEGVAIFFQSDVCHAGLWVDKGQLVARTAERARMHHLFHWIVCRQPAGTVATGRATYSHLVGYARAPRPPRGKGVAHVLPDAGFMPGTKAMGVRACMAACQFVIDQTNTRQVVDPFCGWGTVLAVANAMGLDAVGIDRSARMCRRARKLCVSRDDLRVSGGASGPPSLSRG
jgi:hypothetical protein